MVLLEREREMIISTVTHMGLESAPPGSGESFTEGFSREASRPGLACTRMLLLRLMLSERLVSMRPLSSTIRQYSVTFRASLCAKPFWLPAQGQHHETISSLQRANPHWAYHEGLCETAAEGFNVTLDSCCI